MEPTTFLDFLKVKPNSIKKIPVKRYNSYDSFNDYYKFTITWALSKSKTFEVVVKSPSWYDSNFKNKKEYKITSACIKKRWCYGLISTIEQSFPLDSFSQEVYNSIFSSAMKYISGKRLDSSDLNEYL